MASKIPSASYRQLLKIAIPLIVTSASFTIQNFCDRMFLAWYSSAALQAAVPAGVLAFTLICGFMAMVAFANTLVAQYYGTGDLHSCSRSVAQAVLLSICTFPLILLLIPVGLGLLNVSGHAPDVLFEERRYFMIMMFSGLSITLNAAISSFFSGRGITRIIMVTAILSTLVNIILNWLLIFGHGPFPEMGIAGAGIASVIATFVSPVIMLCLYFSKEADRDYHTRRLFKFDAPLFRRLLRFGIPSGVHMVLDMASFTVFVLLIGRLGETAFVAANIVLSVNHISFMPSIGIGQAAATLVGQHIGRGNYSGASRSGWHAVQIGWIYTAFAAATFLLFPEFYVELFSRSDSIPFDEVFGVARILLIFAAAWGLMDSTTIILAGALRGAGDTHFVMWFMTSAAWFFFALGEFVIIVLLNLGIYVAWGWMVFYICILCTGFIMRFRSTRWHNIQLIEHHL
ncbi:MAG: MATE family efflux transporter [Kiritimatiellales bacterium]